MPGPMSSQGTKIYLSAPVENLPITNVTKAAPAVVTVDTTSNPLAGAVDDWVYITNTGFVSLDRKWFQIETIDLPTKAVTLKGTDTTAETGAGNTGYLTEGADLIEICMASFTRDAPAAATLDVTTLCDTSRQQRSGMKNNGTWTAQGFYDPGSLGQQRLNDAYDAGDERMMKIVCPDESQIIFLTQVNQLSETFAVDQPVQMTAGGVVQGQPQKVLPPGATPLAARVAPAAPAPAPAG